VHQNAYHHNHEVLERTLHAQRHALEDAVHHQSADQRERDALVFGPTLVLVVVLYRDALADFVARHDLVFNGAGVQTVFTRLVHVRAVVFRVGALAILLSVSVGVSAKLLVFILVFVIPQCGVPESDTISNQGLLNTGRRT